MFLRLAFSSFPAVEGVARCQRLQYRRSPMRRQSRSRYRQTPRLRRELLSKILACADADGKADDLPLSAATCDGLTINTGRTINVASDGSVDKTDYTIYKLPMTSEPSDQSTVCNGTSACVLYIGQDQNDFNQPHVWSQPFLVSCTGATCGDSTSSSVAAPTTSSPSGSQPAGSNADSSASVTLGSAVCGQSAPKPACRYRADSGPPLACCGWGCLLDRWVHRPQTSFRLMSVGKRTPATRAMCSGRPHVA